MLLLSRHGCNATLLTSSNKRLSCSTEHGWWQPASLWPERWAAPACCSIWSAVNGRRDWEERLRGETERRDCKHTHGQAEGQLVFDSAYTKADVLGMQKMWGISSCSITYSMAYTKSYIIFDLCLILYYYILYLYYSMAYKSYIIFRVGTIKVTTEWRLRLWSRTTLIYDSNRKTPIDDLH